MTLASSISLTSASIFARLIKKYVVVEGSWGVTAAVVDLLSCGIVRYGYCMGSLPQNGYQISCVGVGRDADHCTEISQAAHSVILQLSSEFNLDLSALDGITFAHDYPKALAELDRGFPTRGPLMATDTPHARGVAMTPTVVRDGEIRFRIVAPAWVGLGLLEDDEELNREAISTLCHEAAHVHHDGIWYRTFPGAHGKPVIEPGTIPNLLLNMFAAFSEYAVCRTTAPINPNGIADYETGFVDAVGYTISVRNEKMRAYMSHRNHQQILNEMTPLFGEFLKLSSYMLGHLDGLGIGLSERAPAAFALLGADPLMKSAVENFHLELSNLWKSEGTWSGFDAFVPLHHCALDLIAAYSVTIARVGARFTVSVAPNVIAQLSAL